MTTMVFPAFSGLFASSRAAHAAAPKLAFKEKVSRLAEDARRWNKQFFAHRMILHPLNGQKTTLPTPRSFEPGTGPQ